MLTTCVIYFYLMQYNTCTQVKCVSTISTSGCLVMQRYSMKHSHSIQYFITFTVIFPTSTKTNQQHENRAVLLCWERSNKIISSQHPACTDQQPHKDSETLLQAHASDRRQRVWQPVTLRRCHPAALRQRVIRYCLVSQKTAALSSQQTHGSI